MSRKKHEVFGTPEGGHLNPKARNEIRKILLDMDGKRMKVTLERSYNKRSDAQNGYYWACVIEEIRDCFEEFWGERWSTAQAHDFNKGIFFGETKVNEDTGTIVVQPGNSSACTTVEFEEVMTEIRQWFALEFGWVIPEPNEELDGEKLGMQQWQEHYKK